MSYEIHILSDEEFEKLPYKDVDDSFGLADPKTNKAYVRRTGVSHLDRRTIEHEFDELLQRVSPHEEDGIRYKKGKKFLRPLLSVASIIPSPIQPFAIAANVGFTANDINKRGFQPLDALALAGPVSGAFKGFKAAGDAATFGQKLSSAGKGALGIGSAASSVPGTTPAGVKTVTVPGVSSRVPVGVAKTGSALSKFGTAALKNSAVQTATTSLQKKFLSPGISVGSGSLPGGAGGQSGALERFSGLNLGETQELSDADVAKGFSNIDANANLRRKSIFEAFRGQAPETNSRFAKQLANINIGTSREKQQFLDEAERKNRIVGLKKTNNLDDKTFNELLSLAKTGTDAQITARVNQDPNEFREIFKGL